MNVEPLHVLVVLQSTVHEVALLQSIVLPEHTPAVLHWTAHGIFIGHVMSPFVTTMIVHTPIMQVPPAAKQLAAFAVHTSASPIMRASALASIGLLSSTRPSLAAASLPVPASGAPAVPA